MSTDNIDMNMSAAMFENPQTEFVVLDEEGYASHENTKSNYLNLDSFSSLYYYLKIDLLFLQWS